MSVMFWHTFVSILRTKIFWAMLLFSVLLISLVGFFSTRAIIQGALQFGDRDHISREEVRDLEIPFEFGECGPGGPGPAFDVYISLLAVFQYVGAGMVSFFSNFAAIFLMMGLLPNELSRRSIYTLVSKPLTRTDIYMGKLLGGWASIFLFTFILGLTFVVFMYLAGAPFVAKFLVVTLIVALSPILFGTLAFVLGTSFRSVAVGFFTMVFLFLSSEFGNPIVYFVGYMWLKWEKVTDFVLGYLPPFVKIKALVMPYIDFSLFTMLTESGEAEGYYKIYDDWWANALFVAAYIIALIAVGWGIFRQKEFN